MKDSLKVELFACLKFGSTILKVGCGRGTSHPFVNGMIVVIGA